MNLQLVNMSTNTQVFLDANVLVYAFDETSDYHKGTVACIQQLLDDGVTLCTSHHVIEEVLHIVRRISDVKASVVTTKISSIPNLVLVEPDATIAFAVRYAKLSDKLQMGINDALLLQLILDAGIGTLFSYDKQFINCAKQVKISHVLA